MPEAINNYRMKKNVYIIRNKINIVIITYKWILYHTLYQIIFLV